MEAPNRKSELSWELFLAGEASPEEKAYWENKLLNDPLLKKQFDEETQLTYPGSYEQVQSFIQQATASETEERPVRPQVPKRPTLFENIKSIFTLKPNWAYSASFMVLFLSAFLSYNHLTTKGEVEFTSKGVSQVHLQLKNLDLPTTEITEVKPGDVLSIRYISPVPLYLQVWYQDDEGEFKAYIEENGEAITLDKTAKSQVLSKQILLDSGWTSEKIFLVSSPKPFNSASVISLLEGKQVPGLTLNNYTLTLK